MLNAAFEVTVHTAYEQTHIDLSTACLGASLPKKLDPAVECQRRTAAVMARPEAQRTPASKLQSLSTTAEKQHHGGRRQDS